MKCQVTGSFKKKYDWQSPRTEYKQEVDPLGILIFGSSQSLFPDVVPLGPPCPHSDGQLAL
jgi:hypothetical protein